MLSKIKYFINNEYKEKWVVDWAIVVHQPVQWLGAARLTFVPKI